MPRRSRAPRLRRMLVVAARDHLLRRLFISDPIAWLMLAPYCLS